jgi:uncharacterized protein (TIGR00255 family)
MDNIKSMTGFGKTRIHDGDISISIELKSVNARYFELAVKIPRQFSAYEIDFKKQIKQSVHRGKVSLSINVDKGKAALMQAIIDTQLIGRYLESIANLSHPDVAKAKLTAAEILHLPEVVTFSPNEDSEEKLFTLLKDGVEKCIRDFNHSRSAEGKALAEDIQGSLLTMEKAIDRIEELSASVVKENVERLRQRLAEITEIDKLDGDRLETEIVLMADRLNINEEIVRLKSHITAISKTLDTAELAGKKLNFLAQEMHREANTIASKSAIIEVSHLSVALREEIEKIREQVQNIE